MGRPKLLLPWGDGMLIDQVLRAWTESTVDRVVIVIRSDDTELLRACRAHSVDVLQPEVEPADMKASVKFALGFLQKCAQPSSKDRCFIAPADLPTLTSKLIDRLAAEPSEGAGIVVPKFGSRVGHPALMSWPVTSQVFSLSDDEGVDRIVERESKRFVAFPAADAVGDVDTPDEYDAALKNEPLA